MEEALVDSENAVVANFDVPIALQPDEGALDFPSSAIAPQLAPILPPPALAMATMRNQQLYSAPLQPFPQRVRVVGTIGDDAFWFQPRPTAPPAGHPHTRERGFRRVTSAGDAFVSCAPRGNPLAIDHLSPLPVGEPHTNSYAKCHADV